jgi:archaellum biogenesis protein FlaJ (TadC family)
MATTQTSGGRSDDIVVRARWFRARRVLLALAVALTIATVLALVFEFKYTPHLIGTLGATLITLALLPFGIPQLSRADQMTSRPAQQQQQQQQKVGMRTAARIFIAIALSAVTVAAIVFELRTIGIGALIVFLSLGLFGGPAWLAAVGDEEELAEPRKR